MCSIVTNPISFTISPSIKRDFFNHLNDRAQPLIFKLLYPVFFVNIRSGVAHMSNQSLPKMISLADVADLLSDRVDQRVNEDCLTHFIALLSLFIHALGKVKYSTSSKGGQV